MFAEQFSEEFVNSFFSMLNPVSFDASFNLEELFMFFFSDKVLSSSANNLKICTTSFYSLLINKKRPPFAMSINNQALVLLLFNHLF